MAIRLRHLQGRWVALCAVETDPKAGDIYLNDNIHHALATKFARDFNSEGSYGIPVDDHVAAIMDSQKVRDARKELEKFVAALLEKEKQNMTRSITDVEIHDQIKYVEQSPSHFYRVEILD